MGVTWLCCAYALHGWLFRPGFSAGLRQPQAGAGGPHRRPRHASSRRSASCCTACRRGCCRRASTGASTTTTPASSTRRTAATITGEGGDKIGRGGRKTIYFVDEAAFLERPESVDRALSQTTTRPHRRVDAQRPGQPVLHDAGIPGKTPVFTFHWRDDPRKGEAWYAEQKAPLRPGDGGAGTGHRLHGVHRRHLHPGRLGPRRRGPASCPPAPATVGRPGRGASSART